MLNKPFLLLFAQIAEESDIALSATVIRQTMSATVFAILGLVVLAVSFWIIHRVTPFSIRKEIEEDQNIALAIIIGSLLIGISIIIGLAIHG